MKKRQSKGLMKCLDCNVPTYKHNLNFDIEKAIKPIKIVPKEIFDSYPIKTKKPKTKKNKY